MDARPRFIVGTGRCGSTLLSRMIRRNPRVLELSEFFVGLDWSRRFQQSKLTGAEYADLLSAPHPLMTMVLQRGYLPDEVTYPFARASARYTPHDPIPWPLAAALPPLASDPDRLFEDLLDTVARSEARLPAEHAARLFEFLAVRFDRDVWIERSAGSLTYLGDLDQSFPDGLFLHLHRQGEDAALSMRAHPVFRLAVMLTYQVPIGDAGSNQVLADLGSSADHVSRLLATTPAAEHFGRWWSEQIRLGVEAGRKLGADRYREVAFERLVEAPEKTLEEISDFLHLPADAGWVREAARLVDQRRASPLEAASRDEALARACAPGNAVLGRPVRASA